MVRKAGKQKEDQQFIGLPSSICLLFLVVDHTECSVFFLKAYVMGGNVRIHKYIPVVHIQTPFINATEICFQAMVDDNGIDL